MEIKDQPELKAPGEMKTPYRNRDKSKYCPFHKDYGHETNECKHLKRALEDLARKGKMNTYLPQWGRKFQKRGDRQSKRKESESTNERGCGICHIRRLCSWRTNRRGQKFT